MRIGSLSGLPAPNFEHYNQTYEPVCRNVGTNASTPDYNAETVQVELSQNHMSDNPTLTRWDEKELSFLPLHKSQRMLALALSPPYAGADEVRWRMSQPSKKRIAPVRKTGKRGGSFQELSISLPTLRRGQRRNAPEPKS